MRRARSHANARAQASDAAQQKERHLLKLRLIENPSLAATAAAPKPAAPAAAALSRGKGAAKAAAPAGKKAASDDSGGMFDDVDDAYEVDTSRLKQKAAHKASGRVRAATVASHVSRRVPGVDP